MQVVSIICDSTKPVGVCKTGFWHSDRQEGPLDAPDWIPAGACYGKEHRSIYTGQLLVIRSAFQRVTTRGML